MNIQLLHKAELSSKILWSSLCFKYWKLHKNYLSSRFP